jgi:predicted house-cleaning NTP pyrophosphatase (Maf/HAM1 superfamily)
VEDYQIMSTMTRVFIASQSPRRREILSSKFNDISILKLDAPEEPRWEKNQTPDAYITHCVNFKSDYAESTFLQKVSPSQRVGHNLVVVADTVVELDNKIFGKVPIFESSEYIFFKVASAAKVKAKKEIAKYKGLMSAYYGSDWKSRKGDKAVTNVPVRINKQTMLFELIP